MKNIVLKKQDAEVYQRPVSVWFIRLFPRDDYG